MSVQTKDERALKARARAKAWYQEPGNAQIARARSKAWYEANKERALETARQSHARRDPAARRASWIKSKYKLTDEEYGQVLAHDGKCDACGSSDRPTEIDHDHQTGAYKGQLCGPCNKSAGHLGDDADRAYALYRYLKERQS